MMKIIVIMLRTTTFIMLHTVVPKDELKTPSKMDVAPWDKHWIKRELDAFGLYSMEFVEIQWYSMVFVEIQWYS